MAFASTWQTLIAPAGPLCDMASINRPESFWKSISLAASSFAFFASDGVEPATIDGAESFA
jgi:hypothetical protein